MKSNIKVIDSIMGSGKTTYKINFMKDNPNNKYLYVTPYLEEVARIKSELGFIEPRPIKGTKLNHIRQLTSDGKSIITTHALMSRFDLEIQENIKVSEYTLILDEVANCVEQFTFNTANDKEDFFNHYAYIDEEGYCVWDEEKHPSAEYSKGSKFYEEMCLCLNRNLVKVNNRLLMWELPVQIFKMFKEVYILTYLFEGSVQKPYFDLFNIEYEKYSIKNNQLIPFEETSKEEKQHIASLINIVQSDKLNGLGEDYHALSSSWYQKNMSKVIYQEKMKNNMLNFFTHYTEAKSSQTMWSTFKEYKTKLKGKGYTKGYLPYNIRATNEHRHCFGLAYIINVFPHYSLTSYFNEKGMGNINNEEYALSILLQWIWRSRIRNSTYLDIDRQIDLYLPSSRMRGILSNWLEG